jgi:ribonuclease HII
MARGDSLRCTLALEDEALASGARLIAGVDEAGRGPLAGPVVEAAVILDRERVPRGIDDSKALSAGRREALFEAIMTTAHVGIAMADVGRIDRDNILNATLWAMAEAVACLNERPCLCLIDGNRAPSLNTPARTIVGGDATCMSIAAASIIAKVTRDRLMKGLDQAFPGYGFARHKGYGTREHMEALHRLGPCRHHRASFAPVRELIERQR